MEETEKQHVLSDENPRERATGSPLAGVPVIASIPFYPVFQNSMDPVLLYSKGRFIDCNQAAIEIMKASTKEAVIGRHPGDLSPEYQPDGELSRQKADRTIEAAIQSANHRFEWVYQDMEGGELWVEVTLIRIEAASSTSFIVTWRDLSPTRKAEEALKASQKLLQRTFRSLTDALFIMDEKGRILVCNSAASDIFGYSREEMLGQRTTFLHVDRTAMQRFRRYLRRAIEDKGFMHGLEFKMKKKDGTVFDSEHSITPLEGDGNSMGWVSVVRDISGRKKGEEALHSSEARYRAMVETGSESVCRWLPDTTLTFVNEAYCRFFGKEYSDLVGHKWMDLLSDEVRDPVIASVETVLESGQPLSYEHEVRDHQGNPRWQQWTDCPITDHAGKVIEVQSVGRDVTEQRRAEQELWESEAKFRKLTEKALVGIYLIQDWMFRYINPKVAEIRGQSVEDIVEKLGPKDLVHPEDWSMVEESIEQCLQGEAKEVGLTFRILTLSEEVRDVEVFSARTSFQGKPAIIGTLMDVTERNESEKALRRAEKKYRGIFDNAVEGVFQSMPEGAYTSVNPALAKMLGYSSPEAMIEEIGDSGHKHFYERKDWEEYVFLMEHSGLVGDFETRFRRKDGTLIWVSISARTVSDESGEALRYEGMVEDITRRKQTEDALRESEERYRTFIDSTSDIATLKDDSLKYIMVNTAFLNLHGKSEEEVIGKNLSDIFDPDSARVLRETDLGALESGRLFIGERRIANRTFLVRKFPVKLSNNRIGIGGLSHDITERVEAEEQLLSSLEEKEVLLREVHHRVKNNMQIVYSLLRLQSKSTSDTQVREAYRESQDRIKSMALVHEHLYRSNSLAHVDMPEYIRRLTSSLVASHGARWVVLSTSVEDLLFGPDIAIPCGLIINELVANSLKHAFEGRKHGEIGVGLLKTARGKCILTVKDNGIGFFPEKRGYGLRSLGLQLVRGLTKQLQGTIEFAGDNGTTVSVNFPIK
jgi:PAS domain S-box-containing protein